MVNGPGITGGLVTSHFAEPWNELMATHMGGKPVSADLTAADTALWARLNGVFWAAFLLFSWTTASIVSGSHHRAREVGRVLADRRHARLGHLDHRCGLGLASCRLDGASPRLSRRLCLGRRARDRGGTCLAVLINLGPRIGKFRPDGTPRNIPPQNPWLVCIGLFLIYTGFWGFYAACNIPIFDVQAGDGVFYSATNIYLQATTLSAITFNFIMSLCGRLDGGLHRLESAMRSGRSPAASPASLRPRPATTSIIRSRPSSSQRSSL